MADDDHKSELVNLAIIARRVDTITHLVERHGQSISEIVNEAVALDMRVRSLENLAQTRAITEAREDERDKVLYARFDKLEKKVEIIDAVEVKVNSIGQDVDTIKSNFSKAAWTVISAIILAVVAFVLKGGLA